MSRSNREPFSIESSPLVKSIKSNSIISQIVEQFNDYVEYEKSVGPE